MNKFSLSVTYILHKTSVLECERLLTIYLLFFCAALDAVVVVLLLLVCEQPTIWSRLLVQPEMQ